MKKFFVIVLISLLITVSAIGCVKVGQQADTTYNVAGYQVQKVYAPVEWGKVVGVSIDRGWGSMTLVFQDGHVLSLYTGSLKNVVIEVMPKR